MSGRLLDLFRVGVPAEQWRPMYASYRRREKFGGRTGFSARNVALRRQSRHLRETDDLSMTRIADVTRRKGRGAHIPHPVPHDRARRGSGHWDTRSDAVGILRREARASCFFLRESRSGLGPRRCDAGVFRDGIED